MDPKTLILSSETGLVGADLSKVYHHFNLAPDSNSLPPSGERARFKKKEDLEKQAKSILKHRIQLLTGKNMAQLEQDLGFDLLRDGVGMNVHQTRRLAHFLILEANGQLPDVAKPNGASSSLDQESKMTTGRKRTAVTDEEPTRSQVTFSDF